MKKKVQVDKLLNGIGILLIIGFVIRLGADYYQYQTIGNSAPFYAFVIGRSFVFLLPSILCFLAATYITRK